MRRRHGSRPATQTAAAAAAGDPSVAEDGAVPKGTRWLEGRARPLLVVVGILVLVLGVWIGSSRLDEDSPSGAGSAGTNFYQPISSDCPYYSAWTTDCYDDSRQRIDRALQFLAENGGGDLQRVWISLDQLFSCFDEETGFCGYDEAALSNVADTLRLMAEQDQRAVLVLYAQPNRDSDVNFFRVEALDGEHEEMRAGYIEAAVEFVRFIAADPAAASAVYAMDMQNEGYFQNRRALQALGSVCGRDGRCIDRELSLPFFTDMYEALEEAAPDFDYTVSALSGELLGSSQEYWVSMYPVDVYDIHLYSSQPEAEQPMLARARDLPAPWFAGETGTDNTEDPSEPCYTYDGNDACTAAAAVWWHQNLGPDYGAQAVLTEHYGAVVEGDGDGLALTTTGRALADLPKR